MYYEESLRLKNIEKRRVRAESWVTRARAKFEKKKKGIEKGSVILLSLFGK